MKREIIDVSSSGKYTSRSSTKSRASVVKAEHRHVRRVKKQQLHKEVMLPLE